ncbi:hypothetical protein [Geotoga petraea]|uniref:Uncharacterized protein n=1 Tax=Geotoga petraea TaxID=28234 RepID=A0A4Z0W1R6_9BACT|nr:hypothetical protein [Geotoga petraea]TGG88030.1 hypothetical protein E4650_06720 [Geotoga petraea]
MFFIFPTTNNNQPTTENLFYKFSLSSNLDPPTEIIDFYYRGVLKTLLFYFQHPTSNFQLPSKKAFSFFTLPTTINKQPEL